MFWKTVWLSSTLSLDWLLSSSFWHAVGCYYLLVFWPVLVSWLHFPACYWCLVWTVCLVLQSGHRGKSTDVSENNRQSDKDLMRHEWQTWRPDNKWAFFSLSANIQTIDSNHQERFMIITSIPPDTNDAFAEHSCPVFHIFGCSFCTHNIIKHHLSRAMNSFSAAP